MPRIKNIIRSIKGEIIKSLVNGGLWTTPIGINTDENRKKKVIISLTSYGRRVNKLSHIVIHSIMSQTYKPDKIILWLDCENWNIHNIPNKLKKLQSKGLDIKFCADIKSYKKLIPTIKEYPNDLIITVDDDVYYESTVIEELIQAYINSPTSIHAFTTSTFLFEKMYDYNTYWCGEGFPDRFDFATGVGAILYDPNLLHSDILNENLFTTLSPQADDLWFYFMEYLKGTHVNMVRPAKNKMSFYPLDSFYQKFHKDASLNASNLHNKRNNLQIKSLMEYYSITVEALKNFSNSNPNLKNE